MSDRITRRRKPRNGTCCACGDASDKDEETPCPSRKDKCHRVHWWEGPDDKRLRAADAAEGA